jgi:hypothetical protein
MEVRLAQRCQPIPSSPVNLALIYQTSTAKPAEPRSRDAERADVNKRLMSCYFKSKDKLFPQRGRDFFVRQLVAARQREVLDTCIARHRSAV